MNILVTGAGGFIGRKLSSRLMGRGHHVFGLSLTHPRDDCHGFKDYYQQDLTKPFSLKPHFDFVFHLAAYNITNVGIKQDGLYTAANVEGTKNLLQAVQARKWVYLSTTKVYKNEGLPIFENSVLSPQGVYEQSKLKAEELCRSSLPEGQLVILRSVNVMGPGQALKAVLPVFFQKAKANQALDIINAAHTPMQYVYVEDLVDAFEALVLHENQSGIFNVAHEETTTLEKLAKAVIALMHSSSALNMMKGTPETLFSPVNCDKAYGSFGWKAKTGLTRILELYKEGYAKNS